MSDDRGAMAVDEAATDLTALPAEVALPRLMDAWGDKIYRLGLLQCGRPEDAEDLVQETFLLAFRNWDRFEGRSRPSTWLYTIASRACRRRRRRRSGEPRRLQSLSDLLPQGERRIPELPAADEGPLDEQLRREARSALEQAIADLPSTFRLALVLKDIAELKVSEVAAILGLKEATVKTRVHRARLFLRRRLAQVLPSREAPPPDHPRGICLDLLRSKQEALDRGVGSPDLEREVCSRCASLFETLDLTLDVCRELGRGELPPQVRRLLAVAGGGAERKKAERAPRGTPARTGSPAFPEARRETAAGDRLR